MVRKMKLHLVQEVTKKGKTRIKGTDKNVYYTKTIQSGLTVIDGGYLSIRKYWRRHPDLNRRITVLQTVALPLGYAAD